MTSFTIPEVTPALDTEPAFAEFERVLNADGARAALAYLVGLTSYRFIGIFRFSEGMANAVIHYDRENPEVLQIDEVPDTATYCCYVRDTRGSFTTVDSLYDRRLADHPTRDSVRAYCGVPIMDAEGVLLGTLCHYDVVPRAAAKLDLLLLLQAASALARDGRVPPYPRAD